MSVSKVDLRRWFSSPQIVARVVPAEDLFGFLNRNFELPSGVAALVAREHGDYSVHPAGSDVPGAGAVEVLLIRSTPIELVWKAERIFSQDRFESTVEIHLHVIPVIDDGELRSFRDRVLGSNQQVGQHTLARYFQPAVRQALVRHSEQTAMKDLTAGDAIADLTRLVHEAVQGPCFTAGLSTDRDPVVRVNSPTYRQVRKAEEAAAARRVEQIAHRQLEIAYETAQKEHMQHLETLLGKLRTMADDSPEVDLPDLIRSFSETERGELYEALFATNAENRSTAHIVVASGRELLFCDPAGRTDQPVRRVTLDGPIGPVRSIQAVRSAEGGMCLLAGAARGVYRLNGVTDDAPVAYSIPGDEQVRGGVNSAALAGGRVLATHSELGLMRWSAEDPANPVALFTDRTQNARAVRAVQFAEGRVYFSIDDRILSFSADAPHDATTEFTGSSAYITTICPAADGVYAGNARGQVLYWSAEYPDKPRVVYSGADRAAESVHLLSLGGVCRLYFTDTSLAVHARVLGDSFTCGYEAGGQTLRRAEVAPDLIAATNEVRDRVFLWSPAKPANPRGIISVARATGHSVQDVCLLPVA